MCTQYVSNDFTWGSIIMFPILIVESNVRNLSSCTVTVKKKVLVFLTRNANLLGYRCSTLG
jgi:hypothetical protein